MILGLSSTKGRTISAEMSYSSNNFNQNKKGMSHNEQQINPWGDAVTYVSSEAMASVNNVSSIVSNQQCQSNLSALGFYSGPIDGNMSSSMTKKAITNFQKVYGIVPTDGSASNSTRNKIDSVYSQYTAIMSSSSLATLASSSNLNLDSIQMHNFAKICVFLSESMGLTTTQAAGVLGNMYVESGFSSDNAQNSFGYPSIHDYSYSYSTTDGVGYGIIQWTYSTRKVGLQQEATNMGLDVSDLNAQLSYFRIEMLRDFTNSWNSICSSSSVHDACDIFLTQIERPEVNNFTTRRAYSDSIYNFLSAL